MYSEQSVIDKIEILEDGQIQIRKANRVLKDGIKISETYHRHCIAPGDNLTNEDPRVIAQAQTAWTEEVVNAYLEKKESAKI